MHWLNSYRSIIVFLNKFSQSKGTINIRKSIFMCKREQKTSPKVEICLFCYSFYASWSYSDTSCPGFPSDSPTSPLPLFYESLTFYPERARTGGSLQHRHLIRARSGQRWGGRPHWNSIGSEAKQKEETLTMNGLLRTHVYNDGGQRKNEAAQDHRDTVSFFVKSANSEDKLKLSLSVFRFHTGRCVLNEAVWVVKFLCSLKV